MLENKIKEVIIKRLNLDVVPSDIDNDAPISNSSGDEQENSQGFDLDSIDALEIVVALNKEFQVKITDKDMRIFQSINTIAAFIKENSPIIDQFSE
jgi:acyl carrier protein